MSSPVVSRERRRRVLERVLACPACHAPLDDDATVLRCRACARRFDIRDGVPLLRLDGMTGTEEGYFGGFKGRLRSHPVLYRWVTRLCVPVLRTGPDPAARLLSALDGDDDVIVDLGGGNDRRHEAFVNVDPLPYPEVDVVANGEHLPFLDASISGVVSVAVLEHVPRPDVVLSEVARVMRPGGHLFLVVPFLAPFHAAPHDYRRWTVPGLVEEVTVGGRFRVLDSGVTAGPTSALAWFLAEWLALAASLGRRRLRSALSPAFQAALSPLKLLDVVIGRLPGAGDLATTVFVHAQREG